MSKRSTSVKIRKINRFSNTRALGRNDSAGLPPAAATVEGSVARGGGGETLVRLVEVAQHIGRVVEARVGDLLRREVAVAVRDIQQPRPTESVLLTVEEVAAELAVEPSTVRKWIRDGYLRATRLGPAGRSRIYRVRRTDMEAFIEAGPSELSPDEQAAAILRRVGRA